jgi:cell division protein FtsA
LIISMEEAVGSIRRAVDIAEDAAGIPIDRIFLNVSGAHVKGVASQAGLSLTSRSREITREDVLRALELARNISIPEDREIIHVLPQDYVLDDQPGIRDPVGLLAWRLEARVYLLTVSASHKQNAIVAANRAGLSVEEVVFAPLASAEAVLRAQDRQLGVALLEMGAGSTGLVVYSHGALVHAATVPIGGDHFTNDLAIAFNTPRTEAERIKYQFGLATTRTVSSSSLVEVPGMGERPPRMVPHRALCGCIEPRAQELIRLVRDDLAGAGVLHMLGSGIVLTGGGAHLTGLPEMLEADLQLPVRVAAPQPIDGMPDELIHPSMTFAVGATLYGHRFYARRPRPRTLLARIAGHMLG